MPRPTTVSFVSLGCAKNLVDSEKMLGQLAEAGCVLTSDESSADVVVINTCGFLQASRTEALTEIRAAVAAKKAGGPRRVVVAGCLVQRDKNDLLQQAPGIDALVGVNNRDDIVRAVTGHHGGRSQPDVYLADYHPFTQIDTARLRITPAHFAYLRISEGCNQKCTFCTIPSIRGPMHSKPAELIVREARELVSDGAVEISLIGQDTTSYGDDLSGSVNLAGLLRQLDAIDGLAWVRLMYAYPSVLTDDILDAIDECQSVCRYIDIPLQHINSRILKAMYRRINRAETEDLLGRIRDRIPGVTIRTTLIAGFPGETDEEFTELLDFVRQFQFDALGVFPYSLEPETPAGRMKGQIPEIIKQERVSALMTAQQQVAFELAERRIGRRFHVLVDEVRPDGTAVARHEGQAPSVDSNTLIRGADAEVGTFLEVRCTGRQDYDLIAQPISVPLPVV